MKKKSQSSGMKGTKNHFIQERLVMDSTTLVPEIREVKEGVDFSAPSLYAACQQVEDGRAA
jgi:hypothetical protein